MLIGYARVSTQYQNLDHQIDALIKAGCERSHIFTDKVSGAKSSRPGLDQALSHLRAGDALVVYKLDRLGKSVPHLVETVTSLQQRGIEFKSLTEQIDTSTSGGKLVFHTMAAVAEFIRDSIRERTHAGLQAARARGKTGGRSKALTEKQVEMLRHLAADKDRSIKDICKTLGISRRTFYRYVNDKQ
ncbi:MAG TPA: recombinase family protein [Nitrososphaera sp.]|nr:recombinase family protein [Nitrososphaera sp.]